MIAFYRLVQNEFKAWHRAITLICLGAIVSQLGLLYSATRYSRAEWPYERFEDLYVSSGCVAVFLVFFAAACGFFLKTFYAQYWGSKSVYTYLTLPVKRETVYASKLAVFISCLLMLIAAQFISIRLGYGLFAARLDAYSEGQLSMRNGLFLAVIRSEFFRILLPLNVSRILSSLCILVALATALYYGVLCERSKKYWGIGIIIAAFFIMIKVLGYRMSETIYFSPPSGLYPSSVLLLILSGFFVWHGIRLMKRGAIA